MTENGAMEIHLRKAELSRSLAEQLVERYDESRRGRLYAWFNVSEGGNVELVETQYATNTLLGPDADLVFCVNSQNAEIVQRAFRKESDRKAKILHLEEQL